MLIGNNQRRILSLTQNHRDYFNGLEDYLSFFTTLIFIGLYLPEGYIVLVL